MRYIIQESRINSLISKYLDSITWRLWDIGDGEFDLSDGYMDNNKILYRIKSSTVFVHDDYDIIYLDYDFVAKLRRLFSMNETVVIVGIIDWFNKKYDKNLKIDDWQYQDEDEEEYDDFEN
jgi:hypothetical protein